MPPPERPLEDIPQAVLDERLSERLPLLFWAVGLLYSGYAVAHHVVAEPAIARVMVPVAIGSALAAFAGLAAVLRWPPPSRWAHGVAFAAGAIAATNVLVHSWASGSPFESLGAMVLLVAAGSLFLSMSWYLLFAAGMVGGWALVAWTSPPHPAQASFAFGVVAAAVAAAAIQAIRLRTVRRYEALLRRRTQVERELRESQARYRLLVDHARDMIWTLDAEGRFTYLSPSVEGVLGFPPADLLGEPVTGRVFAGPLSAEFVRTLERLRAGEVDETFLEAPLQTLSGDVVWCELLASALRTETGEVEAIHAVARDVSQRRSAEEELRLVQFSVDQAGDSILRVGPDGRILFANETTCREVGYSAEELRGLAIGDLHTEYDMGTWPEFWQLLRREEVARFVSRQRTRDGRLIPVDVVVKLIEHQGEEQAFAFVRDISERHEAEEKLRHAKEEAERATRVKSEFLAKMSHEIRTPLNGVIGLTDLLIESELSLEQREQAELLRVSGEALLRIIDNLLDLSKIEAGMLEIESVEFDPGLLLEEVAELFAAAAQRDDLELVCQVDPDVPGRVRGDSSHLRQILTNLASNAVKFTPAGEISLRLRQAPGWETAPRLRFEVRDTGIGIAEEAQGRVFESFVQAEPATAREFGGTGLGLAVCRQLAGLLDGTLELESRPGAGSCFRLEVPTSVVDAASAVGAPVPAPDGPVLLMEGNASQRAALADRLTAWGIEVDAACDAEQAWDRLDAAARGGRPYGHAILAVSERGTGGLELGRKLQTRPECRETRVVWLTPIGGIGAELGASIAAGGLRRLSKPVRAARLAACLGGDLPPDDRADRRAVVGRQPDPSMRVLVAEDNAVNRQLVASLLRRLDVPFDIVPDGLAAVKAVERIDYAAVLMDCHMPGMDGFEATRRIRTLDASRNRHTPILAVTAGAMAGDRARCLEAGMDAHLAKPLRMAALAEALIPRLDRTGIDEAELLRRVDGDRELAGRLARTFLAELPGQLAELERHLRSVDAGGVERAAHVLRGAVSHFCSDRASLAARRLEEAGRDGQLGEAMDLLRALEDELQNLRPALLDFVREAGA